MGNNKLIIGIITVVVLVVGGIAAFYFIQPETRPEEPVVNDVADPIDPRVETKKRFARNIEGMEIIDETIKEDYFFLRVRGIKDLRYIEGTIEMIKENDKWKLLKESWSQVALSHWPKEKMDIAAVDIIFVQKEKGNADLKAIIENNGKMVVPQLSYNFSINGSKEFGSFPVTINPGKKFELDLSHAYSNYYNAYFPKKGSKIEMVLILDPKDELKEFNEENNKITKIFYL